MKKAFLYLLGIVLMATSCLDIADVYKRLDTLEQKVAGLEGLNTTVQGISNTVDALKNNVYVKEVTETAEGYVIKFTNNTQAVIRDGVDGEDGQTPTIGVKEEGGELVWTVNGKVVKDESGKAVPATVKVPEFQFENNKWWYRFGPTDSWKDCGEKTGPEPTITETDEFVIITIGDKSVQIPKEVISPAIEAIKPVLAKAPNLFVPVGESVDLKDFFTVEPEGALKSMVEYVPAEESPITVTDKGILTTSADCNSSVTLVSKANPDIMMKITIRSAVCPNNETPTTTIDPEQKVMIFKGSMEEYIAATDLGGSSNFNPINNSHAAAFKVANGAFNFRLRLPVIQNTNLTMENARLHMWFYISDASVLQSAPFDGEHFLEVSSLRYDQQEVNFELPLFVPDLKTGWNEIDLPFTSSNNPNNAEGPFDITKVCAIRFVCHADTKDKYEVIQIRDLFAYAADAPVQITIDGNMDEWAGVKTGLTSAKETPVYMEFKVSNDDNNIYFYSKRDKNTAIWGGGAYIYYEIDADNNPATGVDKENEHGLETWLYFKPFGGSATEPAIATEFSGDQSSAEVKSNFQFKGKISDNFVEIEASLPLSVAGVTKGSTIRVFSWSNKSGDDFRGKPSEGLLYNVK